MGPLSTFPISLKVAGKTIIIAGGGVEALAKARLAVMTNARVVVIARQIDADFSGLEVELRQRGFEATDIAGAAMVFVADSGPDGVAAARFARRAGVPVNVVDKPLDCDFYTPAIVERAPLTIAISSEGAAPVIARQVRAQIETLVSPKLGALAALAGRLRGKVAQVLPDGTSRRRYFEALAGSHIVEAALDLGVSDAWREAVGLLERQAVSADEAGVVWLIGAGPGAEDLLTLRAQRKLQDADVIVHDQLVPERVVQMGRRDAERINVGKAKGHHSFSQSRINALLVKLAKQGKRVARLKSGDPMIFGRAGEEIAALRKAEIAYEIVPGVTAALAAAADSATPVTLRHVSSGFVAATAHGASDADLTHWAALASAGMTLGLYMGKSTAANVARKLMEKGMAGTMPVGIVVNAGRDSRRLYAGNLGDLAADAVLFIDGPAVILVGAAVAHGDWDRAVVLVTHDAKVA